jgi:hypothetical protein
MENNTMKIAAAASAVAFLAACGDKTSPAQPAADPAAIHAKAHANCLASRPDLLSRYEQEFSARRHWSAADALRGCAARLNDAELLEKVRKAEIASHMAIIGNKQQPPRARAEAMQRLAQDHPETGRRFENEARQLIEHADRADQLAAKAKSKREGVSIGMTQQQAMDSSWGRPSRINRTTTAAGMREQWVYGSGNYLYFSNGILVSIQNR